MALRGGNARLRARAKAACPRHSHSRKLAKLAECLERRVFGLGSWSLDDALVDSWIWV